MKNSTGLPISIQVIGYAFEDEKVLGIMNILSKHIEYKVDMPPILGDVNTIKEFYID